jgi:hypothetical protein
MYNQSTMIRTQMYLEDQIHKDLLSLAEQENKPMAEIARDILREGIKKKIAIDKSGKSVLLTIANLKFKGGDDPYLSENIDHYLYGAPKRKP